MNEILITVMISFSGIVFAFLGYVLKLIYNKVVAVEAKIGDWTVFNYRIDKLEDDYKALMVK